MPGHFITFEGGEGSGKTSLIASLGDLFEERGLKTLRTREPGGTPVADRIRAILLSQSTEHLTPEAELFLYAASRAEHCRKVIVPALEEGAIVLCDRFTDATLAYQGYGRGLPKDRILALNAWATQGLVPELTLFLDCPVSTGLARSKARLEQSRQLQDEGRFEAETLDFHERVRQGYLAISEREPARVVKLDAACSREAVLKQALDAFKKKRVGIE